MPAPTAYPAYFVWEIADYLDSTKATSGISMTIRRPLRPTDPHAAVGVWAENWFPGDAIIGQPMPGIGTYALKVQIIVKHIDEIEGHQIHSAMSKAVRRMLYEDQDLKVRLAAQTDSHGGRIERFQRLTINRQNFMADEVSGQFLFLSDLEVRVETENV